MYQPSVLRDSLWLWTYLLLFLIPTGFTTTPATAATDVYPFGASDGGLAWVVDFSGLNHPIREHDRLFVRNGKFLRVGPDGQPNTADDQPIKLFGVNLVSSGNFPEIQDISRIAKRLRQLGVNLVRLHHMDTSPDANPYDARSILTTGPYPTFNPVTVARLLRFISALKEEGIYINLNLKVGYRFRPETDGVPVIPGLVGPPNQSKPLHIFYPRMIKLQKEFARGLIKALRLKGDPVLAMVEINNESSMVQSWHWGELTKVAVGEYACELQRQWQAFLWRNAPEEVGNEALVGPNDVLVAKRRDLFLRFLIEVDRNYLDQMLAVIRESTDAFVPVAGTQMGYGGLSNLDSHAGLDYQDNHFYVDHYDYPNKLWDAGDWRIRDSSATGGGLTTLLNMAASRESGRPYTISEFNQPWPNRQAAEIAPVTAIFSAFQNWDSVIFFAYSHGRTWDKVVPGGFDLNMDWTKLANFGQAAWLFRSGAIRSGEMPVEIPVPLSLRLEGGKDKVSHNIASFLRDRIGYQPEVALVHPVRLVKDSTVPLPESARRKPSPPYTADTGEFSYDPGTRHFLIHAPRAAGVIGFLQPGQKIVAGSIEVVLAPSARGFATILLTPRDDKPLQESRRILLTTSGYTLRSLPDSSPPRPQRFVYYGFDPRWWTLDPASSLPSSPSGNLRDGIGPVWIERVESYITLMTTAASLSIYPLNGKGERLEVLPAKDIQRLRGGFRIHIQADGQQFAPWYEIALT